MIAHQYISNKGIMAVWLLLLTVATSASLYAQEPETDEIDLLLDELFFNDQQFINDILESFNRYNFIYTHVSLNSNTYFSGRESGVDQFNIVPQLSYYSSSGFNVSISGIYYENFSPNWDFTNVSLGYFNTIGKNKLLTYNAGYTRFFYADDWDTFTNSLDITLGLRTKKRNLGTKLTASYLFGTDQALQLVSRTYLSATITKQKNFVLRFRPQLNFIIAQQTIAIAQLDTVGTSSVVEYDFNDIFDLLNTQLNLPLTLANKSWDFELGYNINFPTAVETESDLNTTGFFNVSIGYLIDLNKN